MLAKMEKSRRNVTPAAFAALRECMKTASAFAASFVAVSPAQTTTHGAVDAGSGAGGGRQRSNSDSSMESTATSLTTASSRPSSPGVGGRHKNKKKKSKKRKKRSKKRKHGHGPGHGASSGTSRTSVVVWPMLSSAHARMDALATLAAKATASLATLEQLVLQAVDGCLQAFAGSTSATLTLEDFRQSPLAKASAPPVNAVDLKNAVLEESGLFQKIADAVAPQASGGTLSEEHPCVVEVRGDVATLQSVLDDYDARAADRTATVADLLDLRRRVKRFFDQALRLKKQGTTNNNTSNSPDLLLGSSRRRGGRHQQRLLQYVRAGHVDKVIGLVIKFGVDVNGSVAAVDRDEQQQSGDATSVSYTHLTLPTIYSV